MKCKWFDVCPLRRFERQGKLDYKWRTQYCKLNFNKCQRYQMEENGIYHPDNMLPDGIIIEELNYY